MNVRFNDARSILMSCLVLMPLTLWLTNCRPELDEKDGVRLGYVDEFCRVDIDCRQDLFCENNACRQKDVVGDVTCREMCERLVDTCGRDEDNCEPSCAETIKEWSAEAINTFGACTLGMTQPQLTCELAKDPDTDAPSFCYRQIEFDAARQQRCDTFVDKARVYASDASEAQLTELRQKCYILGRTRSEADWSVTAACDETLETLTPEEAILCYNDKFELNL